MRDRYGDRNWDDDRNAGWTQERGGDYDRFGQGFDQMNRGWTESGYGEGGYYGQGRRGGRGWGQGGRFGQQGYGQGGWQQGQSGGQNRQGYYGQGEEDWDQGYGSQGQFGGQGQQGYGSQYGGGQGQFGRGGFEQGRYGQMSEGGYGMGSGFGSQLGQGGQGRYGQGGQGQGRWGQGQGQGRWGQAQGQFRGAGPKGYSRSDDRIREDVSDQLEQHDELDAHEIEVRVSQAIVSLSGTVPDRWMKRMAEDIADSCQGVKDVRNELRVESHEHEQQGMSQRGSSQGSAGSIETSGSSARQRTTTTAGRP